ncbi:hypothetical protein EJ08DRAFT_664862 [Tothia fuscella]|uniref:Uncharacterized protein n=1 Tax=Tothia fuscella TaxID=1048955 RepID=A0A9P4TUN0_9PEZI|nr:hypothetical protein EJ08DRAFT_664862 [Tothia fuscella]
MIPWKLSGRSPPSQGRTFISVPASHPYEGCVIRKTLDACDHYSAKHTFRSISCGLETKIDLTEQACGISHQNLVEKTKKKRSKRPRCKVKDTQAPKDKSIEQHEADKLAECKIWSSTEKMWVWSRQEYESRENERERDRERQRDREAEQKELRLAPCCKSTRRC